MANRNIQMKKRTGENWDNLYPITLDSNVFDENGNSVKSQLAQKADKEEVDQLSSQLAQKADFKDFSIDKAAEVYLYDLELAMGTVNQALVFDEVNQQIFATQAYTFSGDAIESFVISRLTLGGKFLDSMTVRYGGHGTTIGIEVEEDSIYIWSNMIQVDEGGNQVSQFLTRYPYQAGTEIDINNPTVQRFNEFPDKDLYMTPFTDFKNGLIAFRHTDKTGSITKSRIEIRLIDDVKNGTDNVLHEFVFNDEMNQLIMQGFALDGSDLYLTFGQRAEDFHLFRINVKTGEVIEQLKRPVGLNEKGEYDEGFGEPEGLYLYTDPRTGQKTLLTVIVTGASGRRRQKLIAFTSNPGIYKFLNLRGDMAQKVKISRDDGKAKRINTTDLSTVREFGWYYFTSDEMQVMSDHPNEKLPGGWWLEVSPKDTGSAVIQRMTRNSTGTPHEYIRVVSSTGAAGRWRSTLPEDVTLFSGDTRGDFSTDFQLSESIFNFDFIYILLNAPNGTNATDRMISIRTWKSNRVTFNTFNIADSAGSTGNGFNEFTIEFNEEGTSFRVVKAIQITIGSTGELTRTDDVSNIGVANIIGIRN